MKATLEHQEGSTSPSAPEAESLGEEFWKDARLVMPSNMKSVHLKLDGDVIAWFQAHEEGHLNRINAVLREYVETQKHGTHV